MVANARLVSVAVSVSQGLLIRIPDQRLGGGPRDAEEVKTHLFFESIDWAALDRKEVSLAVTKSPLL